MAARSSSASRKSATARKPVSRRKPARKASAVKSGAGRLPEWNLADLYAGIDAPEIARDLDRIDAECRAFESDYKGRLATETLGPEGGVWLAGAVRRYEAIDDLAGRLASFAGLIHAGDSVDPAISKFYGDVSERLTAASLHLLFFPLELNRIDDDVIERAMQAPELGHYRPWIRIAARTSHTSWMIASSSSFTRSRRPATRHGTGCSTRRLQGCASRSEQKSLRSNRR